MKVLPWILTIVFATCSALFYSKAQKAGTEADALRTQIEELQTASADAGESQPASADAEELERLRKENEEVYKLRGDVASLRRENQQLNLKVTQLSAQNLEAQSQLTAAVNHQVEANPRVEQEDAQQRMLREQGNMCVGHMTQVEDAKTKWAEANGKSGGAVATVAEIAPYLPNLTMPSCPGGGSYQLNEIGIPVSCSIPEHSLLP